jgi:hypothetical protein
MIISSVGNVEGSSTLVSPVQTWTVMTPSGQAPRHYFQTVLYLRFAAGSLTGGFALDDQSTKLSGAFMPHNYDALHPGQAALAAHVSAAGGMLLVQLDGPRDVQQVVPAGNYSVELSRVDAGKPAVQPTVVSTDGSVGAPGFTDVVFAAQLKSNGTPKMPVLPGDITQVNVRSYPTGPRVGIADPSLASVNFFWHSDGEIGKSAPSSAGSLGDLGGAFAKALGKYLEDAWQTLQKGGGALPDSVEAALVIQSDAPCEFQISCFQVVYHLVLAAGDKQFLKFPGDRLRQQQFAVVLPGRPAIVSASLRALDSFQAQQISAPPGAEPLPQAAISSTEGVRLSDTDDRCAAQIFTPDAAVSADRILLGVLALAANTELSLEIRADAGGVPAGAVLASATVAAPAPGDPQWVVAALVRSAVIPAQPHWLLTRASRGTLVWLTHSAADAVRIGAWQGAQWTTAGVLDGVAALYRVASAVPPPAGLSTPQVTSAPWRLSLGSATLPGSRAADASLTFDLTSALNSYLLTPAPTTATATVPLVVATAAKGGITLYPPQIVYDP